MIDSEPEPVKIQGSTGEYFKNPVKLEEYKWLCCKDMVMPIWT